MKKGIHWILGAIRFACERHSNRMCKHKLYIYIYTETELLHNGNSCRQMGNG